MFADMMQLAWTMDSTKRIAAANVRRARSNTNLT